MPESAQLAALRQLLAARFPASSRVESTGVPTGMADLDIALGGGLPAAAFTEVVCGRSNCGGGLLTYSLLVSTRMARQRVGLLDAADGFAPDELPAELLDHLLWVRGDATNLRSFWTAADLMLRDEHFAVVVMDFRGVSEKELLGTPGTTWYRLQRALERSAAAALVLSPTAVVPCAAHRFACDTSLAFEALSTERDQLRSTLNLRHDRQRVRRALSA